MQPPQTEAPEMAWRGLHTVIQPWTSLLMCFASSYKLLGNEKMLPSRLSAGDKRMAESALCACWSICISLHQGLVFGFPSGDIAKLLVFFIHFYFAKFLYV